MYSVDAVQDSATDNNPRRSLPLDIPPVNGPNAHPKMLSEFKASQKTIKRQATVRRILRIMNWYTGLIPLSLLVGHRSFICIHNYNIINTIRTRQVNIQLKPIQDTAVLMAVSLLLMRFLTDVLRLGINLAQPIGCGPESLVL